MKNKIINNVCMDTQTAFMMNGDINVYPMPYEADWAPITREKKVSYKGRITVMEDGNTTVKAYRIGSLGARYREVFSTEHCSVLLTHGGTLIERWRFDRKVKIHQVWEIRQREQPLVNAFFLTAKEDLAWQ